MSFLTTSPTLIHWLPVAVLLALAVVIGVALLMSSFLLAPRRPDPIKNAPYECGFDPFHHARSRFHVQFYLVAILFIIFDLEVAFLFPWAAAFDSIGIAGFLSMMLFLGMLAVGFIYEWRKGALDWQ